MKMYEKYNMTCANRYLQQKNIPGVTEKYEGADKAPDGGQKGVLMSTWSVRLQSKYEKV